MSIENTRAQIIASIWQAIAQSDVDLSSIPTEQQEKLVNKIAENVILAVDALLDEEIEEADKELEETGEIFIWEGRPFLSLAERYTVTTERVRIISGLISRHVENFELIRIQDIDYKQGITERMFGIGDVFIRGHDPSDPEIVLRNVKHPEAVYELLRKTWLEARKRHGLQFREYM